MAQALEGQFGKVKIIIPKLYTNKVLLKSYKGLNPQDVLTHLQNDTVYKDIHYSFICYGKSLEIIRVFQ